MVTERVIGDEKTTSTKNDHTIFVGSKPLMNYVTGIVMQFTTHNAPEVAIKARGKFISKAVDIAEVAMKRFLENQVHIHDIKTNSEQFTNEEGKLIRVSTIELFLKKK